MPEPSSAFLQHITETAGKALGAPKPSVAVPRALILERAREADYIAERVRTAMMSAKGTSLPALAGELEQRAAKLRKIAEGVA